jgi:hypothetical protein
LVPAQTLSNTYRCHRPTSAKAAVDEQLDAGDMARGVIGRRPLSGGTPSWQPDHFAHRMN